MSDSAANVDTAAFWLSFTLIVIVSATEAALSCIWTRFRVTNDGVRPCEISCRLCGREIFVKPINPDEAEEIATRGMNAGFTQGRTSTARVGNSYGSSEYSSSHQCSFCTGFERRHTQVHNGASKTVVDKFGSFMFIPTLLIRRFGPIVSLRAPAGLVDNAKELVKNLSGKEQDVGRAFENVVHLIMGLTDVALGIAALALNPSSPRKLWDNLTDPKAPISFENYSTLFLLNWLLGALLVVCILPVQSQRRSIQLFALPGITAFLVAALANVALFCLGCWKIDYARRHHLPWTPMLSYWVGGASAIGFPMCGFEIFHIFGVVGLGFMLKHAFS